MTLRNFPPADQCTAEDLDAIADLVVRDPSASYDLAGSREHIEALCRRYQAMAQDLADLQERDRKHEQARIRLGDLASQHAHDLDAARIEIRALQDTLAAERNERQAEVLTAEADRERADTAESIAEIFEATARVALTVVARGTNTRPLDLAELARAVDGRVARALVRERQVTARLTQQVESMALLLDQQAETRRLDDQLRSTCLVVTGQTIEQVNIQLDAELAAHPDAGPLRHARDMREQEDTTP